eukprot:jgi/Phyca11/16644/fgenesh1_pg.PHYCAscaffold_21_\
MDDFPTSGYIFAEELDVHYLALDDFHSMLLQEDSFASKDTARDLKSQRDTWLALELKLDATRQKYCKPYVRVEQGNNESLRYKLLLLKLEERALRQDKVSMETLKKWEQISRIREYSDKDELRTISEWRHSADKIIGFCAGLGPNRFHPFLNDVTLDEIMRYGPEATRLFEVESNCSSFDEPSVTGITSDEDVGSDNERHSLKSPLKRKRKQKTEAARVRQRVYDKKCRHKKKCRLLKTEHETKLLCLAKKNGEEMPSGETARRQVELNQGAVESIKNTTKDWRKHKNGETGKCFLKAHAEEIQSLLDKLQELGEQLNVATSELLWRLEDKTTGVWV